MTHCRCVVMAQQLCCLLYPIRIHTPQPICRGPLTWQNIFRRFPLGFHWSTYIFLREMARILGSYIRSHQLLSTGWTFTVQIVEQWNKLPGFATSAWSVDIVTSTLNARSQWANLPPKHAFIGSVFNNRQQLNQTARQLKLHVPCLWSCEECFESISLLFKSSLDPHMLEFRRALSTVNYAWKAHAPNVQQKIRTFLNAWRFFAQYKGVPETHRTHNDGVYQSQFRKLLFQCQKLR